MLNRRIARIICLALLLLAAFGCQSVPALTPAPLPSATNLVPTFAPTETPIPTLTPTGTLSPSSTATAVPPTRLPTSVPPTAAPTTATRLPTPTLRAISGTKTQLIAWVGGNVRSALAAAGTYAYVAVGPRVSVLDISKPTQPRVVGQSAILSDLINDIALANEHAYAVGSNGSLYVLNISVPNRPVLVGSPMAMQARRLAISGTYMYVVSEHGFHIYSLANPTRLTQVGFVATQGGFRNVQVASKYAYVTGYDGTRIVDISDPTRPTAVGTYNEISNPGAIAVSRSYLWIGTGLMPKNSPLRGAVHVVDVSNPIKPVRVNEIPMTGPVSSLLIRDNLAYIAAVSQLRLFNITDPLHPAEVSHYGSTAEITDMTFVGNHVLLTSSNGDSLSIVSIEHPERPIMVGAYSPPKSTMRAEISGRYALVADGGRGLVVLDISDPGAPVPVSASTPFYSRDISVQGNYAYVGAMDGLHIVNVADPLHPAEVGGVSLHNSAERVVVSGNRAYVASGKEFTIIDITRPSAPTILSSISGNDGYALDVALNGRYAYIGGGYGYGLRVVDIADSAHPKPMGLLTTADWAFGVSVVGNYAYVAAGSAGLRVINVADPSRPVEVGFITATPATYLLGIAVADNRAYVADGGRGLHIIDISDPRKPVELETIRDQISPRRVTVAGDYLYVADTQGALLVLRRAE